jgi:tetraacyldisaccharide 4'-kinase
MVRGRAVVRTGAWPAHVRTVAVGGATLGGSGKTPLAIACAAALASLGARVALVGHAYRAGLLRPRLVRFDDDVRDVGDEALLAARQLGDRARVVVAPSRQDAVDLALRHADILVFDGVAQTAPRRASLALLAVDASEPWGAARAHPPRGDLLAPLRTLLAACDAVVAVGGPHAAAGPAVADRKVWEARTVCNGAWLRADDTYSGARTLLTWADLRALRVGFVSTLARPDRVVRDLEARGVVPVCRVHAPDHGPFGSAFARACRRGWERESIDVWLATPKCAMHVDVGARRCVERTLGAQVATLEHSVALSPSLCARLRSLATS